MPNPWLPHWGDGVVRFDRGWTWPTAAEILAAKLQPTKKGSVKMQHYYPRRLGDQVAWLLNFADKLPGYETVLGLTGAQVDACVASCKYGAYVLGSWLPDVRTLSPAATAAMELLMNGSGPTAVELPVFTAPTPPTGVVAVPPGVLTRLFDLVQIIKNSTGYNETIGQELGIIAPEATPVPGDEAPAPVAKFEIVQGTLNEAVKIAFVKNGHMGVYIESQRGTGAMEFLAIDTEVPYLDDRLLLVAGVPEVRKYRMRFWDKGNPTGDWSDTATLTVGP
jgi:hypothetical protein